MTPSASHDRHPAARDLLGNPFHVRIRSAAPSSLQPPVAAKHPHAFTLHGDSIRDDYAWLRDKADANVIATCRPRTPTRKGSRTSRSRCGSSLRRDAGAHPADDLSVPYRKGGYLYYSRTEREAVPDPVPEAGR
jgi:protease II